jgi:hypothetical protein
VIFWQDRQLNFSRTCSVTNHCRGTTSSVSVTSSPILESLLLPQHGQVIGPGVDDAAPRQVIGKVPACGLAPRGALNLNARLGPGRILLGRRGQFLELQFQLVEQSLAALGARAKASRFILAITS